MRPAFSLFILIAFMACAEQAPDYQPQPQSNVTSPLTPITNMIPIEAGYFYRKTNRITLSRNFWIAKYELTQEEFSSLMATNPSRFSGEASLPVEKITHQQARDYLHALNARERKAGRLPGRYEYRLPTEAEWEYACRAGSTNLYSFGDDTAVANQYAWTAENAEGKTRPAGQKLPNAWGLHDMHGNVWEWVADWFEPFGAGDQVDPTGPSTGKFRVFKGGGWNNDVEMGRCANRFMMAETNGTFFVGMRVALGEKIER